MFSGLARSEDLTRAIAVSSGGGVSEVQSMISGKDAKRSVIKGVVSDAIQTIPGHRLEGGEPGDRGFTY